MGYIVILLITNILVLSHTVGAQNSCLSQDELQTNCISTFETWLLEIDFWDIICNVTGEGEVVYDCLLYQRNNCDGGIYNLENIFVSLFSSFNFNLRASCEYRLEPQCKTVPDCYSNVTNFQGGGAYNFYNFFCGESYFPGLFTCLDGLQTLCPTFVALNSDIFSISSANSGRIIRQTEIQTTTLEQCDILIDSDVRCIQDKQVDFDQCFSFLNIDVPNTRLSCAIADTMALCVTELCGSTVADLFTNLLNFIECNIAAINECSNGVSQCDINADCIDIVGSYLCECKTGYAGNGFTCSDVNECDSPNDCDTNANCINYDGSYLCQCKTGYTGDGLICTDINECDSSNDCDFNANCINNDGSYFCQCKTGHYGDGVTCTDLDECSTDTDQCHITADCINTLGSYQCQCRSGFNGDGFVCSVDSTWGTWTEWNECTVSCDGGIRTRTRICYTSDDLQTNCIGDNSDTQVCSQTACPVTTCRAVSQNEITWPLTEVGEYVTLPCSSSYQTGDIRRGCLIGGEWGQVVNNCVVSEEDLDEIKQTITEVLNSTTVSTYTVNVLTNVTEDLEELTDDDDNFKDNTDVIKSILDITNSVNDVVDATDTVTDEISDNVVGTLSNIIDPKYKEEWTEQTNIQGSDIIKTLDKHLNLVTELKCNELNDNDIIDIKKENIYTEIGRTAQTITFPHTNQRGDSGVTVQRQTLTNLGLSSTCFNGAHYKSPLEFVQKDLFVNGTVESFDGKGMINSDILSVQLLTEANVDNLSPPVIVKLVVKNTSMTDPTCVFLDFDKTKDDGAVAWSTEGCEMISYTETHVTCSCNHLTNFAILMSPSGVSESHTETLAIISAIGCAISMACLLLTIILHCIVWRLVRSDRAVILMNLCVALLIALGIFLVGVNRTESRIACIIVAALIQFFFLAVFFFMLLIGIEILICVVHVFMTKFRIKILLPLAWVLPALIVGISLGISKTNGYGNDKYCWLDTGTGLIWAFIGPVAVIVLVNLVIILVVLKKMASSRAVKSKSLSIKVKTGIRSICVLVPVMGLTWVFGILSVNQDLVVFQYIFSIFNTLQGLCIFLFHCVFNRQIREALKHRSARKRSLQTFSSDFRKQTNSGARRHSKDSNKTDSKVSSAEDWDRLERKQYHRDIRRGTLQD